MSFLLNPFRFGTAEDPGLILCTPAYETGNRSSRITTATNYGESIAVLVDGNLGNNSLDLASQPAYERYFQFDFDSLVYITEAKWYQSNTNGIGTYQWQGWDGLDWVDIGSPFALGGATVQTLTELSGNMDYYTRYRMVGVSGSMNVGPFLNEIEFKECAFDTDVPVNVDRPYIVIT